MSILDPRLWLAAVLFIAATSGFFYFKGRHDEKQIQLAATARAISKADHDAFKKSEIRQGNVDTALATAITRAANDRDRAASADRALVGMRATLDATQRNAETSLDAATKTVAAYRAVFESCTAEYRSLGQEAAGHASDSLTYQQAWPR